MLKILNFRELYFFDFFLSHHLQNPITQKVHGRDEKFYLLFEADEIAFDFKFVVSMEAP